MELDDMRLTMDKTLLTANLFEGFWDRWKVHGVEIDDISFIRKLYLTKDLWFQGWRQLAEKKFKEAEYLERNGLIKQAELSYRTSALYYQLIHWLIPGRCKEKIDWLNISLDIVKQADQITSMKTNYVQLEIDHHAYFGRVRIPNKPIGVIIIMNPLDSTKEELFTYEMDFLEKGLITVSFDGPGQGQTYTIQGIKGTKARWQSFVDGIIEYAASNFIDQNIYLFGTSSGAAWAIYGSSHPGVSKAVAVSPAFRTDKIQLPDYFLERTRFVLEEDHILPSFHEMSLHKPILLVHGKKDVMVRDEDIYQLYEQLPFGKAYLEYEDEGHCCNYKLSEIRRITVDWFTGKWGSNK